MQPTRFDMQAIERRMTKYYDDLQDEIYLTYHRHPTHLKHIGLTEAEEAEYSEMTGVGHWAALGCPM